MEYLSVFLRTILGFLVLWGITRILGQKQISQLTLFDYITGITIGSLTAELVSLPGDWKPMLVSLAVWGALTWLFHLLGMRSRSLHRFLDGTASIVVRKGNLVESEMKKQQLNLQELMSLLRVKGFFSLDEVEFAILETNGELSVLPNAQYRPVQPRDLGVVTKKEGLATQVVHEGQIIPHGLQQSGYAEEWVHKELHRQGLKLKDAFAAWITTDGRLVIDRYDQKK